MTGAEKRELGSLLVADWMWTRYGKSRSIEILKYEVQMCCVLMCWYSSPVLVVSNTYVLKKKRRLLIAIIGTVHAPESLAVML
jgi:hypothetical protein